MCILPKLYCSERNHNDNADVLMRCRLVFDLGISNLERGFAR